MILTLIGPALIALVFGLVVAGGYMLIAAPLIPWRMWIAYAWVLACLCYIILFGPIKV